MVNDFADLHRDETIATMPLIVTCQSAEGVPLEPTTDRPIDASRFPFPRCLGDLLMGERRTAFRISTVTCPVAGGSNGRRLDRVTPSKLPPNRGAPASVIR